MVAISTTTFEKAVSLCFQPLARKHSWELVRRNENTYEIHSQNFIMRIRFWAGMHSKNIDAVLVPAKHQPETTEQEEVVIGIIAIAGYNGIDMDIFPQQQTEDGFMDYARYIAGMAERFGIPYMLGERSDADKVRDYWRTKSEEELEKIRGYKFPSQVQKRWHLPPPPPVDEKK